MRFKDFLLKEDTGLGDLGARMDSLFRNPHFDAQAGAYLNSDVAGSGPSVLDTPQFSMPNTDLTVPQVTRSGRIKVLIKNRNPIYVELSDGTHAHLTYDEWKRIDGQPELGKVMTIVYQRHPEDRGKTPSKIDKIIVN